MTVLSVSFGALGRHHSGCRKTASGRGQVDVTTEITYLDKTAANEALAASLVEDFLMGKNLSKITDYISSEQCHYRNQAAKDELNGIIETVQHLTAQDNMFKYKKIHKVPKLLSEGNFTVTISEGEWSGKPQIVSSYSESRTENSRALGCDSGNPDQRLANNNGKLGFKIDRDPLKISISLHFHVAGVRMRSTVFCLQLIQDKLLNRCNWKTFWVEYLVEQTASLHVSISAWKHDGLQTGHYPFLGLMIPSRNKFFTDDK